MREIIWIIMGGVRWTIEVTNTLLYTTVYRSSVNQVKIRRLCGESQSISAGITIPKDLLKYKGIIEGDQLTGEYYVYVTYDEDEGVLKVPLPEVDSEPDKTAEEALVEQERKEKLSPGEREVLGSETVTSD